MERRTAVKNRLDPLFMASTGGLRRESKMLSGQAQPRCVTSFCCAYNAKWEYFCTTSMVHARVARVSVVVSLPDRTHAGHLVYSASSVVVSVLRASKIVCSQTHNSWIPVHHTWQRDCWLPSCARAEGTAYACVTSDYRGAWKSE